ncbi:MAG: ammonium transporter [Pseudomonadales bacterium]|nr:ammonium transporter [Pseudomonadales bacterium]
MDIFWILIAALLVFFMQAGFLCLESGLVRSKNSINVAAKNISDFALSGTIFWICGFAIMFGDSVSGWFGSNGFFFGDNASPRSIAIFIFQMMFCGTAATLVSGAVAERMSYGGYIIITATISLLIYPVVGHWAWGGILVGHAVGWLELIGFVDFAGSTVVHSVGGWVALAAIIIIGPRVGRFDGPSKRIPGSNLPMAVMGCMLLWIGWFGFNGGSTLEWNEQVPGILLNTMLAAFWGGIVATLFKYFSSGYVDVGHVINGVLGGLVAITAACNVVGTTDAAIIGGIAGALVYFGERWLAYKRIDDAIGVIPVHLFAGIWGTLAVAIFADMDQLTTGLSRIQQLEVQIIGIASAGLYSFLSAYFIFTLINRFYPLRVSKESEIAGLNVTEHRVSTEVFDLLSAMNYQQQSVDFSRQVPVEPFTEVGQIAQQYNHVLNKVNREIQQRDQALNAVKQSEYRSGAILDAAMDCIISINSAGQIMQFNPAAEQCFGEIEKRLLGREFIDLFVSESLRSKAHENLLHGFTQGEGLVLQRQNITQLIRRSGESFPAEIVITRTTDSGNKNPEYTFQIRDITRQNKLQQRLRALAFEDELTGLYNRAYVMENLKQCIAHQTNTDTPVALLFLDIDQFKKINDSLGHGSGDELLREFAKRMTSVTNHTDIVGRWGGDEFVMVLTSDVSRDSVRTKAEQILNALRQPTTIGDHQLTVLASMGIAFSEHGEVSADRLLQHADMAMYEAKQAGRNTYRLFTKEMEQVAQLQSRYTLALPKAITDQQFVLHYQPKVLCSNNKLIGFEALIRWNHPEYGFISPGDFIPIIDESNLIIDVGEWVLTEVVRQLAQWRLNGYKLVPVAVNISGHHMHDSSLVPFVDQLTRQYDIPCNFIELEITEGVLTGNTDESIIAMQALKATGITLSIDDFGTGYSSLSYLKKFPVDTLKIDRAFIDECATNSDDAAICKAIITLAKNLGLQVVAEGVETQQQLEFLQQEGCDYYQGYYFSRPVGEEHIPRLLSKTNT